MVDCIQMGEEYSYTKLIISVSIEDKKALEAMAKEERLSLASFCRSKLAKVIENDKTEKQKCSKQS